MRGGGGKGTEKERAEQNSLRKGGKERQEKGREKRERRGNKIGMGFGREKGGREREGGGR